MLPMNWTLALRAAAAQMSDAGVPDAMRDGRLLLAHAMGITPDRLTLHMHDAVDGDVHARFRDLVAARAARRPLSHLTGRRLFWGRGFHVSPAVLDPRPETEILVAEALREPFSRLLDLGTGSGAIAVSLLAECPGVPGMAVDLSPDALEIARRNATDLGVADRLDLRLSDWFTAVEGEFDLIVSNPPYIALDEMADLSPEVLGHEPRMALTDEGDGLACYRAIAAGAPAHLAPGGRLMVEIGPTQGPAVSALFRQAGLEDVVIHPELDGRDRVVAARRLP